MFHSDLATFLGLDLMSGQQELTQGIGGPETTYVHEVALYLPGGPVKIRVAFKERLPLAGLLGMSGFFEFFKVTFDSDLKICEIERTHNA